MKTARKQFTPKRIKEESGIDGRVGTATQERKIKRHLPADWLSPKVKYIRQPKAASTTQVTSTLITLCFQCHLLPLKM